MNAEDSLIKLHSLHLPNERLVRNIYAEGPEGDFERTKAYLEHVLQAEIKRRAGIAASSQNATADAIAASCPEAEAGAGRLGLLTFIGARTTRRDARRSRAP